MACREEGFIAVSPAGVPGPAEPCGEVASPLSRILHTRGWKNVFLGVVASLPAAILGTLVAGLLGLRGLPLSIATQASMALTFGIVTVQTEPAEGRLRGLLVFLGIWVCVAAVLNGVIALMTR